MPKCIVGRDRRHDCRGCQLLECDERDQEDGTDRQSISAGVPRRMRKKKHRRIDRTCGWRDSSGGRLPPPVSRMVATKECSVLTTWNPRHRPGQSDRDLSVGWIVVVTTVAWPSLIFVTPPVSPRSLSATRTCRSRAALEFVLKVTGGLRPARNHLATGAISHGHLTLKSASAPLPSESSNAEFRQRG